MSWIGKVIRFFEGATNHPPDAMAPRTGPSPADYDAAWRDHERQSPKDEEKPHPRP